MTASWIYITGFVAVALGVLLALARGDRLEKEAMLVLAAASVASALVPNDGANLSLALFAVDGLLLIYLLYRAAFSGRWWAIGAAGFQMLIVATHVAFAFRPALEQWGYFTSYYLWSWGLLLCIVLGILTRGRVASQD